MAETPKQRCPIKHPAFTDGQCVRDQGHLGPHNLEGDRGSTWDTILPRDPSDDTDAYREWVNDSR
jgi:hypothetical protein